jgi:hypothetical protein
MTSPHYKPRPKRQFICPCGCGRLVVGTAAKRYFDASCGRLLKLQSGPRITDRGLLRGGL